MFLMFNKSNITKNPRNKFIILLFGLEIFLVQVFEDVIIDSSTNKAGRFGIS